MWNLKHSHSMKDDWRRQWISIETQTTREFSRKQKLVRETGKIKSFPYYEHSHSNHRVESSSLDFIMHEREKNSQTIFSSVLCNHLTLLIILLKKCTFEDSLNFSNLHPTSVEVCKWGNLLWLYWTHHPRFHTLMTNISWIKYSAPK